MSPRTEETNQHIREEQRERILNAAGTVFARKGFTDTKMTDIATAAKVSYGLAYHYFANSAPFSLLAKAGCKLIVPVAHSPQKRRVIGLIRPAKAG